MPIWAYFMRKAAADPTCGIDTKITFIRPEEVNAEIRIDYSNGNVPIMSGESDNSTGEAGGSATETGYDVGGNAEDIGAESDTSLIGNRSKKTAVPVNEKTPVKPAETKPPGNLPPKPPVPAPKKTGGNE
jgi:penicillin-binding protein 1A